MSETDPEGQKLSRQPVFNVPGVVAVLVGLMWAIHIAADLGLDIYGLGNLRIWLGFIPMRLIAPDQLPGGIVPLVWTGFTHAFLHVDYMHLIFNSAWLAIFGTPVGRRYGTSGVLAVFLIGALAGALALALYQIASINQFSVLLGASGGVSALTGAALRFIFQPVIIGTDPETGERVALGRSTASLGQMMRDTRARTFIIFWLGLNLLIGFAPMIMGVDIAIAWEAHIGGFIAGILLVPALDAYGRRRAQRP